MQNELMALEARGKRKQKAAPEAGEYIPQAICS